MGKAKTTTNVEPKAIHALDDVNLLFTYGTLKRGERAHDRLIKDAGGEFVGPALTMTRFVMFSSGYPMIFLNGNGHYVEGEVYRLSKKTMEHCDSYEGYPILYKRSKFVVRLAKDNKIEEMGGVWIYFRPDLTGFLSNKNSYGCRRVAPNEDGILNWSEMSKGILPDYKFRDSIVGNAYRSAII